MRDAAELALRISLSIPPNPLDILELNRLLGLVNRAQAIVDELERVLEQFNIEV